VSSGGGGSRIKNIALMKDLLKLLRAETAREQKKRSTKRLV
jgi:hypothetical protein